MRPTTSVFLLAALAASVASASAQVTVASKGDQKLTVSGYVQPQFDHIETTSGAEDVARFRRMVLTLQGSASPRWSGTIQFDVGPATAGERVVAKDINIQYLGLRRRGVTITIGNQKPPFSRSLLTSSSRRNLVERPFTGDRSLGSLGRAPGVKVDGAIRSRKLLWSAEIASSLHSPDARQVRTDGISEARGGWNRGVLAVGRIEFQPLGEIAREQGDLHQSTWRYNVALAGYTWRNDGDRNHHTVDGRSTSLVHADTSSVTGVEASAALRGHGWSVDTELEQVASHAIDRAFDGGMYEAGDATIAKASIEFGRMVIPHTLEVVAAYDVVNVGTYARPWRRAAAGLSWYAAAQTLKFQIMHRVSRDERGVPGARVSATFLQAQFAF